MEAAMEARFWAKVDKSGECWVRRRSAAGESHTALGAEFQVSAQAVYLIVKRHNWAYVP